MEKFKRKKAVYDEEREDELSTIIYFYDWYEPEEKITDVILKAYEKNKYPGFLNYLGVIYLYGYYNIEKDEEKAISYLEQAANAGYLEAMDLLGSIYRGKALQQLDKAKYWYDMMGLDYNDAEGKFFLGNILMGDYLISDTGKQCNEYDQYYDGLGLVAESLQMGCHHAYTVLSILDKDNAFMDAYKQKIKQLRSDVIEKLYTGLEENLVIEEIDEE